MARTQPGEVSISTMKQRWTPVAVFAGALFAVNAVARLVVWGFGIAKESEQTRIGLIAFVAIGVVSAVAGAWWAARYPMPRVVGDLLVGGLAGCALAVLLGPFFGGSHPFAEGFRFFVGQVIQFLVLAVFGAFLGIGATVALGRDWKTKGWKRYEQTAKARPPRATRR